MGNVKSVHFVMNVMMSNREFNCPTLVAISGFIILTKKPRFDVLEITLGALTIYFGFFGIFRLQAYVDILLVLCGGYLLLRNTSQFLKIKKKSN